MTGLLSLRLGGRRRTCAAGPARDAGQGRRRVHRGHPRGQAERRVEGLIRFNDPAGNVLEAFHGAQYLGRRVRQPLRPQVRHRRAGPRACGAATCDDDAAAAGVLPGRAGLPAAGLDEPAAAAGRPPGRRRSDLAALLRLQPAPPRLAFMPMPNPTGIVHLMVEVEEADDVGLCLDRALRRKVKMSATLGPAHQRQDVVVLHEDSRRIRHRIRLRGARSRRRPVGWRGRAPRVSLWGHDFSVGFK